MAIVSGGWWRLIGPLYGRPGWEYRPKFIKLMGVRGGGLKKLLRTRYCRWRGCAGRWSSSSPGLGLCVFFLMDSCPEATPLGNACRPGVGREIVLLG